MRVVILLVMVSAMVVVMRRPELQAWLNVDAIRAAREQLGVWAYPVYVGVFGLLIGLWVPGAILLVAGPPIFGTAGAMVMNYLTANVAGAVGFLIARHVTGQSIHTVLEERIPSYARYRRMMERRGLETVLYLRIVPTPFAPVSYLAGVSPVSFWQHTVATAGGILPGSLALSFLSGTVWETGTSDGWRAMMNPQLLLAVVIFLPALMLPRLVRYGRRRWGWFGGEQADEQDSPS
ncbi:MAG: VTT domain-containing protein [Myxococcales bacterium]|nr:VTT domain-containing protein [Myxococcales bacterium]